MKRTISETSTETDVLAEYDVVVVGGGPAGVGAAFASGRSGMKTLIIEQFNCLGGVATAGGHGHMGHYGESGTGRQIVGGIAREIAERIVSEGFGVLGPMNLDFDVEGMKFVLEKMAKESKVDILYHTFFCDTLVEKSVVIGVIVQNKTGRKAILAERAIDCTGDGDVAFHAGCEYEVGRPSDGRCQPVTLMFTIAGVDAERVNRFRFQEQKDPQLKSVWERAQKKGDMEPFQKTIMGWWWTPTRPDQIGVNFTHVTAIDSTNAEDITRATIEARRQAYQTIEVYRKYVPGMERCYMVSTPNTIGIRESRRIMGEYVLTEDDIKSQKDFEDTICYGSFFIDIHNIDRAGMSKTSWYPEGPFKYGIPYRVLVPRKIGNLLVAGRCASVTHIALGSTRVMVPCIAMGEAAGTAASISIRDSVPPRVVNVEKLRQTLRNNGCIVCEEDIVKADERVK